MEMHTHNITNEINLNSVININDKYMHSISKTNIESIFVSAMHDVTNTLMHMHDVINLYNRLQSKMHMHLIGKINIERCSSMHGATKALILTDSLKSTCPTYTWSLSRKKRSREQHSYNG